MFVGAARQGRARLRQADQPLQRAAHDRGRVRPDARGQRRRDVARSPTSGTDRACTCRRSAAGHRCTWPRDRLRGRRGAHRSRSPPTSSRSARSAWSPTSPSEMVTAVLPLYLVAGLGIWPARRTAWSTASTPARPRCCGWSAATSPTGAAAQDSSPASATACPQWPSRLLLAGGSLAAIGAVIAADRTGKGLRTAPRDALITLSAPPQALGRAFGVHGRWTRPARCRAAGRARSCWPPTGAGVRRGLRHQLLRRRVRRAPAGAVRPRPPRPGTANRTVAPPGSRCSCCGGARCGGWRRAAARARPRSATASSTCCCSAARTWPRLVPAAGRGHQPRLPSAGRAAGRLADRVGRLPVFLGGYAALLGGLPAALRTARRAAAAVRRCWPLRRLLRGDRRRADGPGRTAAAGGVAHDRAGVDPDRAGAGLPGVVCAVRTAGVAAAGAAGHRYARRGRRVRCWASCRRSAAPCQRGRVRFRSSRLGAASLLLRGASRSCYIRLSPAPRTAARRAASVATG